MRVRVWASRSGAVNRSVYRRVNVGADFVFACGDKLVASVRLAAKAESETLATELWGGPEYALTYVFLEDPIPLEAPTSRLIEKLGYSPKFRFRGTTLVESRRASRLLERSGSIRAALTE